MPPFTPDIDIVLLTVGTLLVFFEFNRPGTVLPGAVGLLGALLAANLLRTWHVSWISVLLLMAGSALCLLELRHDLGRAWTWLSAGSLALGLANLVDGPASAHTHWFVAVPCGITLGTCASLLARIAHRARQNKGLN